MRIGIDAHMLGDRANGNDIFCREMLDALVPDKGDEYYLFVQREADVERYLDKFKVVYYRSNNAIFQNFIELTRFCYRYDLDVLHTQNLIPFSIPCPVVCTIQDTALDHRRMGKSDFLRDKVLVPYSARHADKIITDSYSGKEGIAETYNVKEKKIEVVCAEESDFRVMRKRELGAINVRRKFGIGDDPYILCDGNIDCAENISKLIRAYVMYRHSWDSNVKLVIIGENDWMYDEAYEEAYEFEDSIIFTGEADREDEVALMNEANGFIHPTSLDDYGITPHEAMNCGTPVAVAEMSDTKRVLGDNVIYFDLHDEEDFYEGICNLIYEPIEPEPIEHTRKDSGELMKKVYRKAIEEM